MKSDDGFEAFGKAIKTDPIGMLLAQWRRDLITRELLKLPEVEAVIESGSLARKTLIGPVHDVDLIAVINPDLIAVRNPDLIAVLKPGQHPEFEVKGRSQEAVDSAEAAIAYVEDRLLGQLHPWSGADGGLVKETEQRRHVVTYKSDWTASFREVIPAAPPVDVMPAVREGSHLLIPERGTGWIDVDPEHMIREVAQRQREWKYFTEVIGMVKAWAKLNDLEMKNLAVEVMVLKYCPRPRLFETLSVGEAVTRFFEAAAKAGITSIKDPAGRCGEIDPSMNYRKLRSALTKGAALARQAMNAEHDWKNPYAEGQVTHPDVFWRELFGKKYPRAKECFWRAPATEPWFGKYTTGPAEPHGPNPPDHSPPQGPGDNGPKGPKGPKGPDGGGPPESGGGGLRDPEGPGSDPGRPRPRPYRPDDRPRRPSSPRGPRHQPGPAPAEPFANHWTRVFGPAAAAASVPLTYG